MFIVRFMFFFSVENDNIARLCETRHFLTKLSMHFMLASRFERKTWNNVKIQEEDDFQTGGWKICSAVTSIHMYTHGESYQLHRDMWCDDGTLRVHCVSCSPDEQPVKSRIGDWLVRLKFRLRICSLFRKIHLIFVVISLKPNIFLCN